MTAPAPTTTAAPPAPGHAPRRLRAMDALRLTAAVAVLLFHFTARDHTRWGQLTHTVFPHLSAVTAYGYSGVHLFFVISGFVVAMSAHGRGVGAFLASRISRLYPAYWAAVLLTATLRWALPSLEDRTPGEVLVNLTMFQDLVGVERVDGVYWTLWVEWQFYLLMIIGIVVGLTRRRLLLAALWVPLVCTGLTLLTPAAAGQVWTFLGYAPLFGAGVVLHVIYRDGPTAARWVLLAVTTAQAMVLAATRQASAIDAIATGGHVAPLGLAAVVLGCVLLVAVTALVPAVRDVDWRVLTWLGALTYPLYLTHEYFGWAVIDALHPYAGRWGTLAVAVGCCFLLAWLVHRLVERPVQRPLRGWLQQRLSVGGRGPSPARSTERTPVRAGSAVSTSSSREPRATVSPSRPEVQR